MPERMRKIDNFKQDLAELKNIQQARSLFKASKDDRLLERQLFSNLEELQQLSQKLSDGKDALFKIHAKKFEGLKAAS